MCIYMALYVNIDQAKEKEMYKKLEKRMAIAAFILLAFFVSRQMLTVNIMGDYAEMSSIINLAGSQRMLSQKIAKDVAMLRPDIDIDRRDHYIVELARTVEIFTEQDALLLSEDHSAVVEHMYEDISETKDKLITSAMTILSYSQNQDGGAISEFNEARITILTTEDNFLMQMDAIVDQYEWEAREAFAWIGRIENIFFAIQIGLLVLVSIIVFIPAHKTFKSMYEEAKENNDNMLRLFHIMRNALFLIDKEGNIQTYNKKAENLLGKIGLDSDISHIRDLFQKSSNDWTQVVELIGPDGTSGMIRLDFNQKEDWEEGSDQIIAMELSVTSGTYRGRESRLLNFYDVTMQKKVEETLTSLVIKDKLTGLYNRYHLETVIDKEIERSERYDVPLSIIILDLDHFKGINDRWGHPVGDQVLIQTAETLLASIRKADSIFRIGGEEFVVVLAHTNSEGGLQAAENARLAIEKSIHPIVGKYTASFGVAERRGGETYRDLYQRADQALYKAKNSGRNCVQIAENESPPTSFALHWKSSWNSGEATIDDQHKTLFRLANELINKPYDGPEKEAFMSQLDALMQHIQDHFAYEESVMDQIHYRDRVKHHKIHTELIKRGNHLRTLVENEEITLQILVHFLFDEVIVGHLLREDVLFFPYIV